VSDSEWVAIGVLGKTRGNRGELLATSLAGRPERFQGLHRVWLFGRSPEVADGTSYDVESVWLHDGRPVLKFRGIDTISDAELLTGAEVRLPLSERMPLEEGAFYEADLIGCEVVERDTGTALGTVTALRDAGGPGILEIQTGDGGELLVPFARAICVNINVGARRIEVDLPEGLKELNRK
jgi:16S rRNA processing protein RimM